VDSLREHGWVIVRNSRRGCQRNGSYSASGRGGGGGRRSKAQHEFAALTPSTAAGQRTPTATNRRLASRRRISFLGMPPEGVRGSPFLPMRHHALECRHVHIGIDGYRQIRINTREFFACVRSGPSCGRRSAVLRFIAGPGGVVAGTGVGLDQKGTGRNVGDSVRCPGWLSAQPQGQKLGFVAKVAVAKLRLGGSGISRTDCDARNRRTHSRPRMC